MGLGCLGFKPHSGHSSLIDPPIACFWASMEPPWTGRSLRQVGGRGGVPQPLTAVRCFCVSPFQEQVGSGGCVWQGWYFAGISGWFWVSRMARPSTLAATTATATPRSTPAGSTSAPCGLVLLGWVFLEVIDYCHDLDVAVCFCGKAAAWRPSFSDGPTGRHEAERLDG